MHAPLTREELVDILAPIRSDILEVKSIVKGDHDVLILTRARSEQASKEIDVLFEKDRTSKEEIQKLKVNYFRIIIAVLSLTGGGVTFLKMLGVQ